MAGQESFVYDKDAHQNAGLDIKFQGIQVHVLRRPLVRTSRFIEAALQPYWKESRSQIINLELDILGSAWLKIFHTIQGRGQDVESCDPTEDDAVHIFAGISFLSVDFDTDEGSALQRLADKCQAKVRYIDDRKDVLCMRSAITLCIEDDFYGEKYRQGIPAGYREVKLEKLRGSHTLPVDQPLQREKLRDHRSAQIILGKLVVPVCGFAMSCTSKVWNDTLAHIELNKSIPVAVPHIELDKSIPVAIWDLILRVIHQIGDLATCWPTIHNAAQMHHAIESMDVYMDDPTGHILACIANQCRMIMQSGTLARNFTLAAEDSEDSVQAAKVLSNSGPTFVEWLNWKELRSLLSSKPWLDERANSFELVLDWARCHGPHDRREMNDFLQRKGLLDILDWHRCPSALRDEAIAAGLVHEPEKIWNLRLVREFRLSSDDSHKIYFLEAGWLITIKSYSKVQRWDPGTGSLLNEFELTDRFERHRGRRELPTHNRILGSRLLASRTENAFAETEPALWDLEDATRVRILKHGSEPTLRKRTYRYITSGVDGEPGISHHRIGVWGKVSYKDSYEYMYNFEPKNRCRKIVALGSSLFTCATGEDYILIDETNLDTKRVEKNWRIDLDGDSFSFVRQLFATPLFVVLVLGKLTAIYVYDRHTSSNTPTQMFYHEEAISFAVSGEFLVSVADKSFKLWDLRSGRVETHISRGPETDAVKCGWKSVGFEGNTVALLDDDGLLQIWERSE